MDKMLSTTEAVNFSQKLNSPPQKTKMHISKPNPKNGHTEADIENMKADETCEEIFYMQTGTYLLDFISDLKYSFDKYYGGLLGKIQTHNIYAFFNKYIDFESSIKAPNRIKGDDSDSSEIMENHFIADNKMMMNMLEMSVFLAKKLPDEEIESH